VTDEPGDHKLLRELEDPKLGRLEGWRRVVLEQLEASVTERAASDGARA
jgi:hypothetical protein